MLVQTAVGQKGEDFGTVDAPRRLGVARLATLERQRHRGFAAALFACPQPQAFAMINYREKRMHCRTRCVAAIGGLIIIAAATAVMLIFPVHYRILNIPLATAYIRHIWPHYAEGPFVVYFAPGGPVAADPAEWLRPRIDAFQKSCDFLEVNCDFGGITFYVFNSREQGKKYGLRPGFAQPKQRRVVETHEMTYGHELTHVIVGQAFGGQIKESMVVNEGLATLLNQSGDPFDASAYQKLQNRELAAPDFLGRNGVSYWTAASLVGYLVDEYGVARLKTFLELVPPWTIADEILYFCGLDRLKAYLDHGQYDEEKAFQEAYGKPFSALFDEWKAKLEERSGDAPPPPDAP